MGALNVFRGMNALNVVRGIVYVLVTLSSLIVLAFSIFDETPYVDGPNPFDGLALSSAIITLLFIGITLLFEGTIRSGVTSLALVEVVRVGILWILWVASGARWYATLPAAKSSPFCLELDDRYGLGGVWRAECVGIAIVAACSMINFFLLFAWFVLLVIFTSVNHHWRSPVSRVNLARKKDPERSKTDNTSIHHQPQQPYYGNPSQQPPGSGPAPQALASYGPGYQGQGFPHQQQQAYQGTVNTQHPSQTYVPYSANAQPVSPPTQGQQQAIPGHSPPMVAHPHNISTMSHQGPSTDEKA